MKNHTRKILSAGFTLVELIIVVVILVLFFSVLGAGCEYATAPRQKGHAEAYAREYARSFMGMPNAVISCLGTDTDRNGYVTCQIAAAPGQPSRQIECVANAWIEANKGCREYRLRTIDLQQPSQQ